MNEQTGRAIIGIAFGYNDLDLFPFLRSLEHTGYQDTLVLFTNRKTKPSGIIQYGYDIVYHNIDRQLSWKGRVHRRLASFMNRLHLGTWWRSLHEKDMRQRLEDKQPLSAWQLAFAFHNYYLTVSRFFFYYNWLLQHSYKQVFFTDVNDVIFQADIFREVQPGVVHAFAECDRVKLGSDSNNSAWIAAGFKAEVLEKMQHAVIYCAGTILCDGKTGIAFLRDLCTELLADKKPLDMNGFDQGVYNYMVSYAKQPYFSSSANGAEVFTVATHPPAEILIRDGNIVAKNVETVPAVVHQYNRHKKLVDFITESLFYHNR